MENQEHNHLDKYHQVIADSKVETNDAKVEAAVKNLLDKHFEENNNKKVYEFLLNCIDLTTLSSTDGEKSVAKFVEKVNDFDNDYPQYKNVAAICVYSKFADVVRTNLDVTGVNIAVCSANFPSSQARLEVKTTETMLAVGDGANEVDIVFPLGLFGDDNYEEVADEISEIKQSCRDAHMKVIIESGCLKTAEKIRAASILSMYSGADFIKTSTGKIYDGASVEAAYTMCQCIKEYYEKHGEKIGFKAAGGISTPEDAVRYYTIVKEVLGEEWLNNGLFRIGASRLANNLFQAFTESDVKPF